MNTAEKCQQLELAPLEMGRTTLKNKCKSSSIWIKESVVGVLGHSKKWSLLHHGIPFTLYPNSSQFWPFSAVKRQAFG